MVNKPLYKRVVLKLSGEALMGATNAGIDPQVLDRIVGELKSMHDMNIQIAIVVGGGNLFRGQALSQAGMGRVTGDFMGMLATMMNALAIRDACERAGLSSRVLSAIPMTGIVDSYHHHKAIHHLMQQRVVIFAGGTGNPFVTTDSAASLRAVEIEADVLLKATNVDGIYAEDPKINPSSPMFQKLSFKEALQKELAVMDLAAFCQCRDYEVPIRVFNINTHGNMTKVVLDESVGTLVS
jgi:uridylate kinase